jgi:hypothetical protein
MSMTGILVSGDNHFVVSGPRPDRATALALIRHWSLIQIGAKVPDSLREWAIVTRELRENLVWAVVVPADTEVSRAVAQLLFEVAARGVDVHRL